jgi:hypothetical protein
MLKILCEKGIAFEWFEGHGWQLLSTRSALTISDPQEAARGYCVRPLLLVQDFPGDGVQTLFLPNAAGKSPFTLQPSELTQEVFKHWNGPLLPHAVNMNYVIGAVVYHCKKLAELYSQITQDYAHAVHVHNVEQPNARRNNFGQATELLHFMNLKR